MLRRLVWAMIGPRASTGLRDEALRTCLLPVKASVLTPATH